MTDCIRLLPDVVANQIAAGEVVNHPSSVVKEMMENAIDAGATSVTVNFRDGGKELIQVVDDGCGMSPVDARLAFDRHATSKITSVDDIYKLGTFGFRGEALASIAAVAQVELRTRQAEDETGTQTDINGGEFAGQKPIMCTRGSQFFVRNLFYNVPARRRFLDKSTTSALQIKTEFRRVALCNPEVHFELYANDAPIFILPVATLAGRIVDVVGRYIKQNLLEVEAATSIVNIGGFVGRPAAAKKANAEQYLFVNGRFFRSNYFQKAIQKAYEKLIPEGAYPSFFLYLTIDPERIDVNVHPQKTEVKFADQEAVWQIIHAAVRETLGKTGAVPLMDFDEEGQVDIPILTKGTVYREPPSLKNASYNPFREGYADTSLADKRGFSDCELSYDEVESEISLKQDFHSSGMDTLETIPSSSIGGADFSANEFEFVPSESEQIQQPLIEEEKPAFTAVLPLNNGYVAALYGGRLVLVDLRRAKECILYEEHLLLLRGGSSVSQQLLFPEKLMLSEREYALLEENAVDFAALGFDIDYQGKGTIEVNGTPADLPTDTIDELIYELIQLFDTPIPLETLRREKIAEAMAQNGAKSLPRNISVDDATLLLTQLSLCEQGSFSPSGKAVMAEISMEEIRAKLG
ncbi:MAG: DNA mismatch repair endonuclease MutL [Alistipes sp.]